MKVTAIMATCGRHRCCERSLTLFLDQDYVDKKLLIYQNSEISQELDSAVNPDLVMLVNNSVDLQSGKPYTNLGSIYNDALKFVPSDTDVIIFWDDDDLFLDDHISQGINGLIRGGKTAYKPKYSFYRTSNKKLEKWQNTFEPSIFVKAEHIFKYGFFNTTTTQHRKWLDPLELTGDIFIDKNGKSTLIYNWADSFYSYKTSANHSNPDHFNEYREKSLDHGDRVISPIDIFENL